MTYLREREQGITLIGFLLGLVLLAFALVMVIRIVPMYTEYYNVSKALDSLSEEDSLAGKSNYEIKSALYRRLQTNYVRNITAKQVRIVRKDGVRVRITYEVRKGLIANLDVVGKFDKEVLLGG